MRFILIQEIVSINYEYNFITKTDLIIRENAFLIPNFVKRN